MKKIITLVSFLTMIEIGHAQVPSWAIKKSLGYDLAGRKEAGMVSLNNKLYILGGSANMGLGQDFSEYNPATGVLRKLGNMGLDGNQIANCLFAVKGKIYSFDLGRGVTVYDTLQNAWTTLPGNMVGSPDVGFVINDTIYMIMEGFSNDFYSYNIQTNRFTKKANHPGTVTRDAIAFAINGKGYWGSGSDGNRNVTNSFYEYDPIANTWTSKASLPLAFTGGIGISYNGKGYASGYNPVLFHNSLYEYNPISNVWVQKQDFLYSSLQSSVAIIKNEIFIFGGVNSNITNDNLYKYSIENNVWSLSNPELGGNRVQASGFYANGKIYAGSGHDEEGLYDFWEYDIATNQWAAKAPFKSTHCQRGVAEINGKGYFVGGYGKSEQNTPINRQYIDSLLEYNPANNQWLAKKPFPGGKSGGMVAMAYNGKMYAGLGTDPDGSRKKEFFEFNPSTNSWTAKTSAPFTSNDGYYLSSFAVGDTAYVLNGTYFYKYSFTNDSWTSQPLSNIKVATDNSNAAFAYNGKGYMVQDQNKLAEYNPATGKWRQFLNLPFRSNDQTIIPTPNSIYFGFGLKAGTSNDLRELKFDAGVSKKAGLFQWEIVTAGGAFPYCGSGVFSPNTSRAIHDSTGKLFAAIVYTGTLAGISSGCAQVNSRDSLLPFREISGRFSKGYDENVLLLNKSVHFSNNSAMSGEALFRMYFTSSEINKFVTAFNTKYNKSYTMDSIKIFRYNGLDLDPANNNDPNGGYLEFKPTVNNYGVDKYLEVSLSQGGSISGEVYAVLATKKVITSIDDENSFANKLMFYPNPASDKLYLKEPSFYIVSDMTGKLLLKSQGSEISLSGLNAGFYYISINGKTEKFIKE